MKFFILTFLLISAQTALTQYETDLEDFLDTEFFDQGIDWPKVKEEFTKFTLLNYKKEKTVNEFFFELSGASKKKKKKQTPFITAEFKQLASFSKNTSHIIPKLEEYLYDLIIEEKKWCEMQNITAVAMLFNEINYWSLNSFTNASLASQILNLDYKIEDVDLYEKIALMLILNKIFDHSNLISRWTIAEEKRNKIELVFVKPEPDNEKDTSTTDVELYGDEVEPCFLGGVANMSKFIMMSVIYPREALEEDIQGIVYVQFIVDKDGTLNNVSILKSPHDILSRESVRIVQSMPKWLPGFQAGSNVRVRYTIPINFRIS